MHQSHTSGARHVLESDKLANKMRGKRGSDDQGIDEGRLGPRIAGVLGSRPEVFEAYLFG